ncbi:MAG: VCBS repeat domain-containing M23 family metallopeptidase [Candidatus Spechtbacterales bacterium]|nr:VCBS repeat domain-containing M23 family metallopeptidase [Candidatus Spechtbacterales bacterium]
MKKIFILLFLFAFAFPLGVLGQTADIIFPVLDSDSVYYRDDFGDPRGGGTRSHEGIDILGEKMLPLIAAADGTVRRVNYPEASWGTAVILRANNGYSYWYLHMNNDTPGTDDGMGSFMDIYAPYMERGNEVSAGQLIGWMGDSGNAESTPAHLHFEIHDGRDVINPYPSLQAAREVDVPAAAPKQDNELLPFGEFNGGASIAYGNFDRLNSHEFVVGAGPGGAPHVRMMTRDGKKLGSFYAYIESFSGGVDVAAGDLDGDGIDEIITGAGPGGGPHVKIFNADGTPYQVEGFFAYIPEFTGGVNVAAADIDNDGRDEIITGAGPGGGPHVRVFDSDGTPLGDGFFAYGAEFRGGVDVSASDGSSSQDGFIITGAGPGGGPHVKIFNTGGQLQEDFYAYDEGFLGGVRVSAGDIGASGSFRTMLSHNSDDDDGGSNWWDDWWNNDDEPEPDDIYDQYGRPISDTATSIQIITSPAKNGGADIRIYNTDGTLAGAEKMFEQWWQGGYDVAAGEGITFVSTTDSSLSYAGGRRVSVREGPN